mmetsp:Transcript_2273/g.8405  ORF Transcript_2273/g.8405 Transcript_2273/m.8405 type:complete len:1361 (-) Transcript_2273:875-4957(-)
MNSYSPEEARLFVISKTAPNTFIIPPHQSNMTPCPPEILIHIHLKWASSPAALHSFYHHSYYTLKIHRIASIIQELNHLKVSVPVKDQRLFYEGLALDMEKDLVQVMYPDATTSERSDEEERGASPTKTHDSAQMLRTKDTSAIAGSSTSLLTSTHRTPFLLPRIRFVQDVTIFCAPRTPSEQWQQHIKSRLSSQKTLASLHLPAMEKHLRLYLSNHKSQETPHSQFYFKFSQVETANRGWLFHMVAQFVEADILPQSQAFPSKTPAIPFRILVNALEGSFRFESEEDCIFAWCEDMNVLCEEEERKEKERRYSKECLHCHEISLDARTRESDVKNPFAFSSHVCTSCKDKGFSTELSPFFVSFKEMLSRMVPRLSETVANYFSIPHKELKESVAVAQSELESNSEMTSSGESSDEIQGPHHVASITTQPQSHSQSESSLHFTPPVQSMIAEATKQSSPSRKRPRGDQECSSANHKRIAFSPPSPHSPIPLQKLSNDALGWCFSFLPNNYDLFLSVALTCKQFYRMVHQHHTTWQERFLQLHIDNNSETFSHLCAAIDQVSPHLYHLRFVEPWYNKCIMPEAIHQMDPLQPRYRGAVRHTSHMTTSMFHISTHPIYKHVADKLKKDHLCQLLSLEFSGDFCRITLSTLVALINQCKSLKRLRVDSFITNATICPRTDAVLTRDRDYDYACMQSLKPNSLKLETIHLSVFPLMVFSQEAYCEFFVEALLGASATSLEDFSLFVHEKHPQREYFNFSNLFRHKLLNRCTRIRFENVRFVECVDGSSNANNASSSTSTPTSSESPLLTSLTESTYKSFLPRVTSLSLLDDTLSEREALLLVAHLSEQLTHLELRVRPSPSSYHQIDRNILSSTNISLPALKDLRIVNVRAIDELLKLCPHNLTHLHVENTHTPLDMDMLLEGRNPQLIFNTDSHQMTDISDFEKHGYTCRFSNLKSLCIISKFVSISTSLEMLFLQNAGTLERLRLSLDTIHHSLLFIILKNLDKLNSLSLSYERMDSRFLEILAKWKGHSYLEKLEIDPRERGMIDGAPLATQTPHIVVKESNHESALTITKDIMNLPLEFMRSLRLTPNRVDFSVLPGILQMVPFMDTLHIGGGALNATTWLRLLEACDTTHLLSLSMCQSLLKSKDNKYLFGASDSNSFCPLWVNMRFLQEFHVTVSNSGNSADMTTSIHAWSPSLQNTNQLYSAPLVDLPLHDYIALCYVLRNVQVARGIFPNEKEVLVLAKLVSNSPVVVTVDDVLSATVYEMLRSFVGSRVPVWKCKGSIPYSKQKEILSRVHQICRVWHHDFSKYSNHTTHQISELQIFLEHVMEWIASGQRLPLLIARLRWEIEKAVEVLNGGWA